MLASAQHTIELIWRSTTGTGTPGTNTIKAKVGDVLDLDVIVTDGGTCSGIFAASVPLTWDAGILAGSNALLCPYPENDVQPGDYCNDSVPNYFINWGQHLSAGYADFAAVGYLNAGGYFCEPMYLGRVTYTVQTKATTNIVVDWDAITPEPDYPGVWTNYAGGIDYPDATATVKPPSGC